MDYHDYFIEYVLKEISSIDRNKILKNNVSTNSLTYTKLGELFFNGKLTEKLIISLQVYFLLNYHTYKNKKDKFKDKEILKDLSYSYIKKKGYYSRLKNIDFKNGYRLHGVKKKKYTKYENWKKSQLISQIHYLEHCLWKEKILVRKLEDKYGDIKLGMVIFD